MPNDSQDLGLALDRAHANGLLVNNLFQTDDGRWRANIRDTKGGYDFAHGQSPAAALHQAINIALTTAPEPFIGGQSRGETKAETKAQAKALAVAQVSDLLSSL